MTSEQPYRHYLRSTLEPTARSSLEDGSTTQTSTSLISTTSPPPPPISHTTTKVIGAPAVSSSSTRTPDHIPIHSPIERNAFAPLPVSYEDQMRIERERQPPQISPISPTSYGTAASPVSAIEGLADAESFAPRGPTSRSSVSYPTTTTAYSATSPTSPPHNYPTSYPPPIKQELEQESSSSSPIGYEHQPFSPGSGSGSGPAGGDFRRMSKATSVTNGGGAALTFDAARSKPPRQTFGSRIKTFFRAFNTPNQLALLAFIGFQAVCVLTMIGLIYATINAAIGDLSFQDTFLQAPKLESVATYVGLFILAVIFEVLVSLDALQQKNIISIYLLVFFQIAMIVYSALLPGQLSDAVQGSSADTGFVQSHVQGYAITIPCIIGITTLGISFLSWRLNDEFNWELFRRVVGPEVHLKRMYLVYQIFVCFLKFDAFFFIGFSIQFLVLVKDTPTVEFVITITALPLIIVFLFLSSLFVKHEFKPGSLS